MLRLLCAMLAATPATASCVFENARLYNESGHMVTRGRCDASVALYFAGEWCPLCRRFTYVIARLPRKVERFGSDCFVFPPTSARPP